MPTTAPQAKIEATRGYGAETVLEGLDFSAAVNHARTLAERPGTELIHAFDDPAIVAGQGTLGLELLEDVPELDTIIVPIGGSGLIAGISAVLAEKWPDIRIIGVQASSAATVPDSLDKDQPTTIDNADTIADGVATGSTSELTFAHIREHVDKIVTVTDEEIATGIVVPLERAKQLVEGVGAASVAALTSGKLDVAGETVVPIFSGGNRDMSVLKTILTHDLTSRSQMIRLHVHIDDGPGQLSMISDRIADRGANIRTVQHIRADDSLSIGQAYLEFLVETSGEDHASWIISAIEVEEYLVDRVN